jgi:hypothetical protein
VFGFAYDHMIGGGNFRRGTGKCRANAQDEHKYRPQAPDPATAALIDHGKNYNLYSWRHKEP